MWQFKKIKLTNWQSFIDQEYEFKNGIPVLLVGINNDADDAESNGSGKSSLQEALYYIITGESIRKVKNSELINNDCESCEIELTIFNSISNRNLIVTRQLSRKSAEKLIIKYEDKADSEKFSSINEGNKLLISFIGISSEDIKNNFIVNKEKYTSFFYSSDTQKKALIGRFSNADKILPVYDKIQDDIKKLGVEGNTIHTIIAQNNAKISVYNEELINNSDDKLNEEKQQDIDLIQQKIDSSNEWIRAI